MIVHKKDNFLRNCTHHAPDLFAPSCIDRQSVSCVVLKQLLKRKRRLSLGISWPRRDYTYFWSLCRILACRNRSIITGAAVNVFLRLSKNLPNGVTGPAIYPEVLRTWNPQQILGSNWRVLTFPPAMDPPASTARIHMAHGSWKQKLLVSNESLSDTTRVPVQSYQS